MEENRKQEDAKKTLTAPSRHLHLLVRRGECASCFLRLSTIIPPLIPRLTPSLMQTLKCYNKHSNSNSKLVESEVWKQICVVFLKYIWVSVGPCDIVCRVFVSDKVMSIACVLTSPRSLVSPSISWSPAEVPTNNVSGYLSRMQM